MPSDRAFYDSFTDRDGVQTAQVAMTPVEDKSEKIVLARPYVIPIVFLPGIMGTNLKKQGSGATAWRPPNADLRGAGETIGALFSYLFKNAEERRQDLAPEEAEVDPGGPIDRADSGYDKKVLRARGWGAVMRQAYHPIMGKMQSMLNDLAKYDFERCEPQLQKWAADQGLDDPTQWGGSSLPPLTKDEIVHAANYQFEVWAAGYNWLKSNADSGAAVKQLIESVILPYYNEGKKVEVKDASGDPKGKCEIKRPKPPKPIAEGVIVVTHSMGGLVSRALTEIHACDKVLGVVHGVQPATGAPATYKRMRAGFEGPAQVVLGRNAAEVTAVLAQAPGGLELLPTFDYDGGKPWLLVADKSKRQADGSYQPGDALLALPTDGDPYGEIYTSPAWYGLVPEGNTVMMSSGGGGGSSGPSGSENRPETPRSLFDDAIDKVKTFHQSIARKYKSPTYAHYGAQGARNSQQHRGGFLGTGIFATENRNTWGQLVWEGEGLSGSDPKSIRIAEDDGNGTLKLASGQKLKVADPAMPGDATVPEASGKAPAEAGVAGCFAHGQGQPGDHNRRFGYEHQASYNDKYQRTLFASFYGVIKIAQLAAWHQGGGATP